MPVDPLAAEIYPPAGYSPWWWTVVVVCALGIVAVLWWARRALRTVDGATHGDGLVERLRAEALAAIDRVEADVAAGGSSVADGAARLSGEVRRFAGMATNGDADYLVLPELRAAALREPRLEPVVAVVAQLESSAFEPDADRVAFDAHLVRAREVVRQWS